MASVMLAVMTRNQSLK